jgi:glycosyltransferase involved in cell wall biosynthesis
VAPAVDRVKILYLSDAQIPSRSSNSMQVMRMCEAFARLGHEVELVHARAPAERPEGYQGDLAAFYGVDVRFRLRPVGLPFAAPRALRAVPLAALLARRRAAVVYARSLLGAGLAAVLRRRVVAELHDEPISWPVVARLDGAVAISGALRDRVLAEGALPPERVIVEHDGVDLERVNPRNLERDAARAALGIEAPDGPLVVYTGRAIAGKGVDVLVEAAERIRGRVLVVGRVYDDALRASNAVRFGGFVPPARIPEYLAAADVLVMPTTPSLAYAAYSSPLKLFEYMASGRPVVAADLPALREVVEHERNALLYPPYDADALAACVERLWRDRALAERLAAQARRDVQPYAWERRAERIAGFLERMAR